MAAAPAAPRIFVSYARSDGKEPAAKLRRRLQDEDLALWQDLTDMEGGKDWWRQITGVIDQIEYLLLVMTPNALRSEVVRNEWRYGRQQGRCVIPIMGAQDLDFGQLAGWMRRTHFVDIGQKEQWDRLVATLRGPCQATRVPFMVDDLPENFVARPAELDALIAHLLDEDREAQRFAGHRGWVGAVAALPGRGQALSAGDDGTVRMWDLASGEQLAVFEGDAPFLCSVTADERLAVAGDGRGQIHVLEILL